jgi:RNA polymerase sigma-70 factor (ECF subfamily)
MAMADGRKFKALIEPELEALYRTAFRLARNRPDAEDLVQETCVRAIERLGELRATESVRSWLLTVLHNVFVDGSRRARRSPVAPVHDSEFTESACPEPNPEAGASMSQREEQLCLAWSKLERGHQVLLALRAEGYSISEIAKTTDLPTEALYARLYRARLNLAQHLNDEPSSALEGRREIAK